MMAVHAPADDSFIARLSGGIPDLVLRPAQPKDLEEPRGQFIGRAGAVALPANVEDVAAIVRAANAANVAVVPLGGGTGLVGGQTMVGAAEGGAPPPLLLSLERMNRIRAVHARENLVVVEAGITLAQVQDAARDVGRLFPLSLASQASAQTGGVLSTNAGGVRVLRYGTARNLCLGIEAVLPQGDVWNGLKRLHKDNTGYDLRNLLIGAEGTLGVITAAVLRLFPEEVQPVTALLAVANPEAALNLLHLARQQVGDAVVAFELIHRQGFDFLAETIPEVRLPWDKPNEWMILVDLAPGPGADATAMLETIFVKADEAGFVSDAIMAQTNAQRAGLWRLRESIPEANRRIGALASHDIALPLEEIPRFIDLCQQQLMRLGDFRINCFGHLGDGNLHFNVFPQAGRRREDCGDIGAAISDAVHQLVHAAGGTFSAEHGVGRLRVGELARYGDAARLRAMRAIKNALDPKGIMNPGVIFSEFP